MVGLSVCRNQDLANVFYRLELIEAYGTGISKIMKAYEGSDKTPMIETTNNAFKIILPNINYGAESTKEKDTIDIRQWILDFAKENGSVTRSNVEKHLKISSSTVSRILKKMVEEKLLAQCGKGRSIKYVIPNQQ